MGGLNSTVLCTFVYLLNCFSINITGTLYPAILPQAIIYSLGASAGRRLGASIIFF